MSKIYIPKNRAEIHYLRKYAQDAFIFLTILYDTSSEEKNGLYSVYEFYEDLSYKSTRDNIGHSQKEEIEKVIEKFYSIVDLLQKNQFINIVEDSAYCDIKVELLDWTSCEIQDDFEVSDG